MQATALDPAVRQTRLARRQRAAAATFIAIYVIGWAWLVGLTDPSRWQALLAAGFAVLFALVLVHEIVATARSLRTSVPQPHLSGSMRAEEQAVAAAPQRHAASPAPTIDKAPVVVEPGARQHSRQD